MAQQRDINSPFDSDIITIFVGPEKKRFAAHKKYLTKCQYFRACLGRGFKEGNTNEIHLPEDDPKVFNTILHVLYHDELARLLCPISGDGCDAYLLFNLLLDVYIAADKYCFELLQNMVVTFFAEMCKTTIFRATLISRLTKVGLVDSRLRALLLQNKAYELAWEGYAACSDYDKTLADVFQGGGVDSVHILEASLVLAQADGEDPALIENYCDLYHVHHTTKKCKTATR